jgi:hypothetical protein
MSIPSDELDAAARAGTPGAGVLAGLALDPLRRFGVVKS